MKADNHVYLHADWYLVNLALTACEKILKAGLNDTTQFDYDHYGIHIRYFG